MGRNISCLLTAILLLPTRNMVRSFELRKTRYKELKPTVCRSVMTSITASSETKSTNVNVVHNISQHMFSVAPMMDYTDAHQRYLQRLISREAVLYTEMVTCSALIRGGDVFRFLQANFDHEDPVVLQLGGSNPREMFEAAKVASDFGYKQININSGCPSEKVAGKGCFGAALMQTPDLVAELALSVGEASGHPATVKCRIGVDDDDSYEQLCNYVRRVSEKGSVNHFIVHARKAVLGANFSPADNRKIPPLKYDYVYSLVKDFPHLSFSINGGINTYEDALHHIQQGVVGVMVGRAVINNPFYWKSIDSVIYGKANPDKSRLEVVTEYAAYAQKVEDTQGSRARNALVKPLLGLFSGEFNGRLHRRAIDELNRGRVNSVGLTKKISKVQGSEKDLSLRPIGEVIIQSLTDASLPEYVLNDRASSPPPRLPASSFTPSFGSDEDERRDSLCRSSIGPSQNGS